MTSTQSLFYALGEMAYAIASADGTIQKEEKEELQKILVSEFSDYPGAYNYTEIIFHILQKDKLDLETTYNWAIREIKFNKEHLTAVLSMKFIKVIEKVAHAFPPVTADEQKLVDRFIKEIITII